MNQAMDQSSIQGRPGLHFEHLRQIVRLRRASGWLGIAAVMAALAFYQLHRKDPALFEAADTCTAHQTTDAGAPATGAVQACLN